MENQIPNKLKVSTRKHGKKQAKKRSKHSKSASTLDLPTSSMSKLVFRVHHSNHSTTTREKKDDYQVRSKSSLLKDIKNTAINGITQVKQRFNSFSTLLKPLKSKSDLENYREITNQPTPVKLYSPFTIETPPLTTKPEERMRLRQQLFTSPRNQLKNDIESLGTGINQLNLMVEKIPNRYRQIEKENEVFTSKRNIFPCESLI